MVFNKKKLNSVLLVIMAVVMCFSLEMTIIDAAQQMTSSNVSLSMFQGDRYQTRDGMLMRNGEAVELDGGQLIKYGLLNGVLCALVEKNGTEEWVEVGGPVAVDSDAAAAPVAAVSESVPADSINEVTIYRFLTGVLGLNEAAACGVLANIYKESGFDPASSCIDTNGLVSYGICQWNGGRFNALQKWCRSKGYDYRTLTAQLLYLKYELGTSESDSFSRVKGVDNSAQGAFIAGYNWASYYERCASGYYVSRATLARDYYWPRYTGGVVPAGGLSEADLAAASAGYAPYVNPNPGTAAGADNPAAAAAAAAAAGQTPAIIAKGQPVLINKGQPNEGYQMSYSVANPAGVEIVEIGVTLLDAAGNRLGNTFIYPKTKDLLVEGSFHTGQVTGAAMQTGSVYKYQFKISTAYGSRLSDIYSFQPVGDGTTTVPAPEATETETAAAQIRGAQLSGDGLLTVQYTAPKAARIQASVYSDDNALLYSGGQDVAAGAGDAMIAFSGWQQPAAYRVEVKMLDPADLSKLLCSEFQFKGTGAPAAEPAPADTPTQTPEGEAAAPTDPTPATPAEEAGAPSAPEATADTADNAAEIPALNGNEPAQKEAAAPASQPAPEDRSSEKKQAELSAVVKPAPVKETATDDAPADPVVD